MTSSSWGRAGMGGEGGRAGREAGGRQVRRGGVGGGAAAREETDLQQRGADQDFLHALQVQVHLGRVEVVQDLLHRRVGHAVDQDLLLLRLTQASGEHAPSGERGDCSQRSEAHRLDRRDVTGAPSYQETPPCSPTHGGFL